jgi:hypothetical protein
MSFDTSGTRMPAQRPSRSYGWLGILCGFLSLTFLSEIFGSLSIILGAMQIKKEPESSFGIIVVIVGVLTLLIGIYFTAYPLLVDLLFGGITV